jgi:hypothetical protein
MRSPKAVQWRVAQKEEIDALIKNGTFIEIPLESLPPGTNILGVKFIFKEKLDANGNVCRHKARLVVLGYSQRAGIDYKETFAPVARFDSIRLFLSVAAAEHYHIHQMDVRTAFLNPTLDEEIYIQVPDGMPNKDSKGRPVVLRLLKSLYGLKQAPRAWNSLLDKFLTSQGFTRSVHDSCIYTRDIGTPRAIIISVYVDDLLIASPSLDILEKFKRTISSAFAMSDLGQASFCLGIKITYDRSAGTLSLSQEHYVNALLERFNEKDNPITHKSPMEPGCLYTPQGRLDLALEKYKKGQLTDPPVPGHTPLSPPLADASEYRALIGALLYLANCTRPDLAHSVSFLSRFLSNPTEDHMAGARRILLYAKGTRHLQLTYSRGVNRNCLTAYSDSDYNTNFVDGMNVSGGLFLLNGAAVTWLSRKQTVVTHSSTAAEYIALGVVGREVEALRHLLKDLGFEQPSPTKIHGDNMPSFDIAKNPVTSSKTRHLNAGFQSIRKYLSDNCVELVQVRTAENIADGMTKPLSPDLLLRFRKGLFGG